MRKGEVDRAADADRFRAAAAPGRSRAAAGARAARPRSERRRRHASMPSRPPSCARRAPRWTKRAVSASASRRSCSAASRRRPISKRADAALEIAEGRHQDALEEVRNRQAVLAQRRSELALARQQLDDTIAALADRRRRPRTAWCSPASTAPPARRSSPSCASIRCGCSWRCPNAPRRRCALGQRVRVTRRRRSDGLRRPRRARQPVDRRRQPHAADRGRGSEPRRHAAPGHVREGRHRHRRRRRRSSSRSRALVVFAGVEKILVVKDGKAHEQRVRTGRRVGDASRSSTACGRRRRHRRAGRPGRRLAGHASRE